MSKLIRLKKQVDYFTRQDLMKLSKRQLITIILKLQSRVIKRISPTTKQPKLKKKRSKRKMSLSEKRKFIARLNKGRIKKGLKPIRMKK